MRRVTGLPFAIQEGPHVAVPMADGRPLAAPI